jgi:hypothetical protein
MAYQVVTAVASAARTTSGNGAAILPYRPDSTSQDMGDQLCLLLAVTASGGTTPTLTVGIEWSHDGGVTWAPAETPDAFTQVTGTGNKVKTFPVKGPTYRIVWTIGGTTPTFTFGVTAFITT